MDIHEPPIKPKGKYLNKDMLPYLRGTFTFLIDNNDDIHVEPEKLGETYKIYYPEDIVDKGLWIRFQHEYAHVFLYDNSHQIFMLSPYEALVRLNYPDPNIYGRICKILNESTNWFADWQLFDRFEKVFKDDVIDSIIRSEQSIRRFNELSEEVKFETKLILANYLAQIIQYEIRCSLPNYNEICGIQELIDAFLENDPSAPTGDALIGLMNKLCEILEVDAIFNVSSHGIWQVSRRPA